MNKDDKIWSDEYAARECAPEGNRRERYLRLALEHADALDERVVGKRGAHHLASIKGLIDAALGVKDV